ncbi:hypothetical protein O181_115321 [Austropuccinia psidii MF-1]|uniref:Uncharacterized protein n=1 Tax=Austropuccinia psidii MF-1 TaxID=1389203 RepID=A0A9Q3K8M5_9BASI|nr:hypothetical protein [Austropuccinia psidii MF-1]
MGYFLVSFNPWVPRKIGPRGPPIAPMDHGLQRTVHGPWTIGPQETQMATKAIRSLIQKINPRPRKGQRAMNSISVKNNHRKGQGPRGFKTILRHFQGYWGQDPLEDFSKTRAQH